MYHSLPFRTLLSKLTAALLSVLLLCGGLQPYPANAEPVSAPAWTSIDGGASISTPNQGGSEPSIVAWNNELYAVWIESVQVNFQSYNRLRVKRWTGTEWLSADGGNALNADLLKNASSPNLAVYKDNLYVIWSEVGGTANKGTIRVKKYDGQNWTSADGEAPLAGTLNTGNNRFPVLTVFKDELYAGWVGNDNGSSDVKIQIRKYNGSTWTSDASNLAVNAGGYVYAVQFAIYDDNLYLAANEDKTTPTPISYHTFVLKRTGNASWTNVSGSSGLSDTTKPASSVTIRAYDGRLYAVWRDSNTSIFKVKSYDGNGWSDVGSGTLTLPTGIKAQIPRLTVYNGKLFMAWVEYTESTSSMRTRIQQYDGTGWTAADNGLTNNMSNGTGGPLAVVGDKLYLVWSYQGIRASQYQAVTAPAAPTGLKAEPGVGEVSLSWDIGSGTTSYEIYKGTSSGIYDSSPVDTVSGSTGSYTATGLANGTIYYFAVRAVNGGGSSDYSGEASATAGVLHVGATAGCDYKWTTDAEQAAQICNANPLQAGTFVDYDADHQVYNHRITRQSVLKFNLPSTSAPIASARLKFFVTQPLVSSGAPAASVIIHTGDSAWEPQAVSNGSIVAAPEPLNTAATPKYTIDTGAKWYTIDVTSTVWDRMDNGAESMVFLMEGTDTADDTLMSGFSYLSSINKPELELTYGTRSPAPALTGLTWGPGGTPGTTKLAEADGNPQLWYLVGSAGRYSQPPLGADAAELGYTQTLNKNENIPVTSGQHIYVLQTDSSGKILKWADVDVEDQNIAQPLAPEIVGLTWNKGGAPGTTKATHLPGDATYKYVIGGVGTKTKPSVGDDAAAAGYTNALLYNADIAVESGDHIYVVLVDSLGKIVKWADVAIEDKNIAPTPAGAISGLTWDKGGAPGTTKTTHLPGDATYKYVIGGAGAKTQPNVGDDAAAAGYTNELLYNADISVESGDHIYVVLVDSLGKIVKWSDVAVEDRNIAPGTDPQPDLAPEIVGLTWDKGGAPGTTKATHLPGDATYKYVIGAAGAKTQPNVGDDASTAGYTHALPYNTDIAVESGDHLYVVLVDSLGKIVKWTDVAVEDRNIAPGTDPQPDLAPEIVGLTWDKGDATGTTKATHLPGDATYKYVIGAAGAKTQPNVGDDAGAAGYTNSLSYNTDIAVESGNHIYVVLVDSLGKIVKWSDVAVEDKNISTGTDPQSEPAAALTGLSWAPGGNAGTTKATAVDGDPILRYAVSSSVYAHPSAGADASQLGYTIPLNLDADIAVTSGQHIYVVAVDSAGKIVKWADVTVEDRNIAGSPPVVNPYNPPASIDNGVSVLVNGSTRERMATASVTTVDGKKTTIISLDSQKLGAALAEATQGYVVTIPVANQSDIVIGELDAQTVKNMADKRALLEVKTENASYTLPAEQINVVALASKIGTNVALSDIKIRIEIANVPAQDVKFTPMAGEQIQIVAPAVDFTIKLVYQGQEVTLDKFNAYVERMIALPAGIDPNKITTGVVVLADGSILHVPTKVKQVDGRYYAVINSVTNSLYSVIYNVKTFGDIAGHWARASIEDMAARLVVNGSTDDNYFPDEAITRAEFAAIIVRALGLHTADRTSTFSDVAATDWYSEAVSIASSYRLLQGYPDGTFGPNRSISRQEAMAIAAKAMIIAGMDTAITSQQQIELLAAFADAGQVGEWARQAAALNVKYGVISGNAGLVRPQDPITRAETAAVVQRLLRKANLIQ